MTVREAIDLIRDEEDVKMSLNDIAEAIGVSRPRVSKMLAEPDEGMQIKVGTLVRIVEALGAQLVIQTSDEDDYVISSDDSVFKQ